MIANNGNGNNYLEKKLKRLQQGGKLRVIDLFSGCGGLSLGFQRAGFTILGGVESDAKASKSHALNFFKGRSKQEIDFHSAPIDITDTSPDVFMLNVLHATSPDNLVDVIVGGPPCQAFARIGRAKLRQIAEHPEAYLRDERANLYLNFLKYVDFFRPLAVLIENVPDILNFGGKNVAEEIASSLDDLGYQAVYTLLNAVNYGVPQFRLRFFLIAFHKDLNTKPDFPAPSFHITVPTGYTWERVVAMKHLQPQQLNFYNQPRYTDPPEVSDQLPDAVTARQAIEDLPVLTEHLEKKIKSGVRAFTRSLPYRRGRPTSYALLMRTWPGYEAGKGVVDHVIRYLPRDYEIFRLMNPDDQYPEAHTIAMNLLQIRVKELEQTSGIKILENSSEYAQIKKELVPPYKVDRFPNKWWKINPNMPVRTLTAHIGKDTYTHIHYESTQARVISVREAARFQSFPDGFVFVGPMNHAFRQIGNSVPPLMAYALAKKMLEQIQTVANRISGKLLVVNESKEPDQQAEFIDSNTYE